MRSQQKIMFGLLLILSLSVINQAQSSREATASSYLERGIASLAKGEKARASADFDLAITSDPQLAKAWYNRSILRYDNGDFEGTVSDLDQAIKYRFLWALDDLADLDQGNAVVRLVGVEALRKQQQKALAGIVLHTEVKVLRLRTEISILPAPTTAAK